MTMTEWQAKLLQHIKEDLSSGKRLIMTYPPHHGRELVRKQLDKWTETHLGAK